MTEEIPFERLFGRVYFGFHGRYWAVQNQTPWREQNFNFSKGYEAGMLKTSSKPEIPRLHVANEISYGHKK